MKDLKDYAKINEKGELELDIDLFKADLDRERNQSSETARANAEKKLRTAIESEIRKKIEDEAKLTAEEKLAKEREALANERKQFNADRIKALYKTNDLFSDEEIESFSALITDDYNLSLQTATKLVEARKKRNEEYEKGLSEKLQLGTPRTNGNGSNSGEGEFAKKAKEYSQNKQNEVAF